MPPEWYKPFENFPVDVPPLVPFGEGYRYHITGLHHDERGYPTNRPDEVQPWLELNADKLEARVVALPTREDVQIPVEEQLIVEMCGR